MLINEVEHIVGLSKKSIRYYELNGLLTPKRNRDNDYRIYDDEDIEKLKKIKFLRELGVPISELKLLDARALSLEDCLESRIIKIREEEKKYERVLGMCREIKESHVTFDDIDITKYFQNVNILGKEGFTMRDVKSNKAKKIVGAILSSIIFSLFFVFMVVTISYFQFTETEKMPWLVYWILMIILGTPILGIVSNLIARIIEVLGGEEDEASKY